MNFTSLSLWVTPLTIASSIVFSFTIVPSLFSKVDLTIIGILYLLPNSTDLAINTPAPVEDISNISSYEISSINFAFSTYLGSAENTPSTSVKISHLSAFKEAAKATAVASEPPLPRVVISLDSLLKPWNPATITILPSSRPSFTLSPVISSISAFPCLEVVIIPA